MLSSISSGTEGKGSSSIFGLMDGIMGSPKGKGAPWTDGEVGFQLPGSSFELIPL